MKLAFGRSPLLIIASLASPFGIFAACSAASSSTATTTTTGTGGSRADAGADAGGSDGTTGGGMGGDIGLDAPGGCMDTCSADLHTVIDCQGNVVKQCSGTQGCDAVIGTCADACQASVHGKQAIGCEYYATVMDTPSLGLCFAAFVANTWNAPAHIQVDFAGTSLPVGMFAAIPSGAGPMLTYGAYDPVAGLAPDQVAILFLSGDPNGTVPCPITAATKTGGEIWGTSDIGHSFHVTTDVPVVAYEMNPYGGGSAAVTGASLLLPVSAWDRNYIAVTVTPNDLHGPSMNIIAAEDGTEVVMLPKAAIAGGGQLAPGPAMMPYTFTLNQGEQAQFTQVADLTGSIIEANKPIGFMAGQPCMREPYGVDFCDHGEQMVPPVSALGSEYVGAMFRPRVPGDEATWRVVGTVSGTLLTYSSDVGGLAMVDEGEAFTFTTDQAFHVQSQDSGHPFMLFSYMSGSQWDELTDNGGYGDPDFVISVPPQQYLKSYIFFTDPTYPETNLVVVRSPNAAMSFDDVTLDCAGALTGWQPVGGYEWTRIDLIRHDFVPQGNCTTGRHEMSSNSPFGLWVWGWGTPETTSFTSNVSYGYPGGMNVQTINQVVIPPTTTKAVPHPHPG